LFGLADPASPGFGRHQAVVRAGLVIQAALMSLRSRRALTAVAPDNGTP